MVNGVAGTTLIESSFSSPPEIRSIVDEIEEAVEAFDRKHRTNTHSHVLSVLGQYDVVFYFEVDKENLGEFKDKKGREFLQSFLPATVHKAKGIERTETLLRVPYPTE